MSNRIKYIWPICFSIAALMLIVAIVESLRPPGSNGANYIVRRGSRIFRAYVLEPIPESVDDFKFDQIEMPLFSGGHMYVMRFKISKADTELILKSREFKEFEWDCYKGDYLHWKGAHKITYDPNTNTYTSTSTSGSLPLYRGLKQQPPEWFKPNDWDNAKVYKYEQDWGKSDRVHTKILIFNEELEEAYFVEDL